MKDPEHRVIVPATTPDQENQEFSLWLTYVDAYYSIYHKSPLPASLHDQAKHWHALGWSVTKTALNLPSPQEAENAS